MNKKWGLIFVTSIFRKFQQIITKFGKIHSLKVIYSLFVLTFYSNFVVKKLLSLVFRRLFCVRLFSRLQVVVGYNTKKVKNLVLNLSYWNFHKQKAHHFKNSMGEFFLPIQGRDVCNSLQHNLIDFDNNQAYLEITEICIYIVQ